MTMQESLFGTMNQEQDLPKSLMSYLLYQAGSIYKAKPTIKGLPRLRNSTPDICALANACIALIDGGTIGLVRGDYKVRTTLAWQEKPIRLIGEASGEHGATGKYGVKFTVIPTDLSGYAIKVGGDNVGTYHSSIERIEIDGMGTSAAGVLGGIWLRNLQHCCFRDILVKRFYATGKIALRYDGTASPSSYANQFDNIELYSVFYGWYNENYGTGAMVNNLQVGTDINDNARGVYMLNGDTNRYFNLGLWAITNAGSVALYIDESDSVGFFGIRIEPNCTQDITIEASSTSSRFFGGSVTGSKITDNGFGTIWKGVRNREDSSYIDTVERQDQSGAWASPSGSFSPEGRTVLLYNSTAGEYRLYSYVNGGWRYVALTT